MGCNVWCSDSGHYCANTIWLVDSDKDKIKTEVAVAFWSKHPGPKDIPSSTVHMPFWARKPRAGISIDLVNDVFIASEAALQGGGASGGGASSASGHAEDETAMKGQGKGREKAKAVMGGGWLVARP